METHFPVAGKVGGETCAGRDTSFRAVEFKRSNLLMHRNRICGRGVRNEEWVHHLVNKAHNVVSFHVMPWPRFKHLPSKDNKNNATALLMGRPIHSVASSPLYLVPVGATGCLFDSHGEDSCMDDPNCHVSPVRCFCVLEFVYSIVHFWFLRRSYVTVTTKEGDFWLLCPVFLESFLC